MSATIRHDVVTLGELVIDLVPARDAAGRMCFAPKPGGAPGNVAVGVARLGRRAAMLSKVGKEALGELLVETLASDGVVTEGVLSASNARTSLAVVTVEPDGERAFTLYRDGCADTTFAPSEVDTDIIRAARILHVGTLFLGQPTSAAAQRHAVHVAHLAGLAVSVDVNLRTAMWPSPSHMRTAALEAVSAANFLKVSEEELACLSGTADLAEGVTRLWQTRTRLIAVTLGAAGAFLATARHCAIVPGFKVHVVDTVGCGDAFVASLLADLCVSDDDLNSVSGLENLARRACAVGAIAATAAGAMEGLPTLIQRDAFLASHTG